MVSGVAPTEHPVAVFYPLVYPMPYRPEKIRAAFDKVAMDFLKYRYIKTEEGEEEEISGCAIPSSSQSWHV
jgi:hypothetical protein